jgi:hypothetical protein
MRGWRYTLACFRGAVDRATSKREQNRQGETGYKRADGPRLSQRPTAAEWRVEQAATVATDRLARQRRKPPTETPPVQRRTGGTCALVRAAATAAQPFLTLDPCLPPAMPSCPRPSLAPSPASPPHLFPCQALTHSLTHPHRVAGRSLAKDTTSCQKDRKTPKH